MSIAGICPKCGEPVKSVNVQAISAVVSPALTWHAIAYICPNMTCQAVLGCQADPVALKADTVREISQLER